MRETDLLQTKSYRILRERLEEAVDEGINSVVYGPPSSEKSFLLERLCAQFREKGRPVIYAYCGAECTEGHLYRTIAKAAGIRVQSSFRWAARHAVLNDLLARPELPAIVLDEAQHMDVNALEGIRQIHDMTARSERRGCGIILAGSHSLLQFFLAPRRRAMLEQTLSRFGHRVQLEGMQRDEILTLAARAWGNGRAIVLSVQQKRILLEECEVDDPYYVDKSGKSSPRKYYSCRRLLEFIRQQKKSLRPVSNVAPEA
jgi:DNA transposition AAA+ family ATPase